METGVAERSVRIAGATRSGDVLGRLRHEIITCRLRPAQPLRFEGLRAAYGVSFSTLRDVLTTLTAEGLVNAEGQRGFHVAPISREDLLDLTAARVLIERQMLLLAVAHGGDDWEVGVLSALHRLSRAEEKLGGNEVGDADWRRLHEEFHDALASGSGSLVLMSIRASLFKRAERYRSLSARYRPRDRDKTGEHRKLMQVALARDGEQAAAMIEAHIRGTTQNVLTYADEIFSTKEPRSAEAPERHRQT